MNGTPLVRFVARPLVLALLFACLILGAASVSGFGQFNWSAYYVTLFGAALAIEAYFSDRAGRVLYSIGGVRFRLIELGVLFALLQLGSDLVDRRAPLRGFMPVFEPHVLGYACILLFVWTLARDTAADLERLGEPPAHSSGYMSPVRSLSYRYLGGILILAIVVSLVRIKGGAPLPVRAAPLPPAVDLLVYAATGMLLFGHAYYTHSRITWRDAGITMPAHLANQWAGYTVAFVALVLVLAFFMPAAGATQIIAALGGLFAALGRIGSWTADHFGSAAHFAHTTGSHATPTPHLPAVHRAPATHPPNLGPALQIGTALVVAISAAVYLIRVFRETSPGVPRFGGLLGRMVALLNRLLDTLWGWLAGSARTMRAVLPSRSQAALNAPTRGLSGRSLFRPRAQTARDRIIRYYLSTLRRAGRRGFSHRPDQTANEFQRVVTESVPAVRPELEVITSAFLEARYSDHAVDGAQLTRMHEAWRQMRGALRRPD